MYCVLVPDCQHLPLRLFCNSTKQFAPSLCTKLNLKQQQLLPWFSWHSLALSCLQLYRLLWLYVALHDLAGIQVADPCASAWPLEWRNACVTIAQHLTPEVVVGGLVSAGQVEAGMPKTSMHLTHYHLLRCGMGASTGCKSCTTKLFFWQFKKFQTPPQATIYRIDRFMNILLQYIQKKGCLWSTSIAILFAFSTACFSVGFHMKQVHLAPSVFLCGRFCRNIS